MMVDVTQEECERIKQELAGLRQLIMRVEPMVMLDGRFERMITSPLSIVSIAAELIEQIPELREMVQLELDAEAV